MRSHYRFITLAAILILLNCVASTHHIVKRGYNVNAFQHISIAPLTYDDGTYDKYGIESELAKVFSRKGFNLVDSDRLNNLPDSDLFELLICEVRHFHNPDALGGSYATVIIKLSDIRGNVIYQGKGKYQGMTVDADISGAVDRAILGFNNLYTGFDQSLVFDPEEEFKDWESINMEEEELKRLLDKSLGDLNPIEGIWTESENNRYRIGIFEDTVRSDRNFVAIILESDSPFWRPKQVKMELKRTAYETAYTTTYYMNNHDKQGTTAIINDVGLLELGLKDAQGKRFTTYFIKNYPENIEGIHDVGGYSDIDKAKGSGFLLSEAGIVVTNYHIVEDKTNIEVRFPQSNKSYRANPALKDSKNDIVLLRLEEFDFDKIFTGSIPYSNVPSAPTKVGQDVFLIGFPLGEILGGSARLSDGKINSVYGIQDDPRLLQISNPVQPGNSGSPLFNENGEVIGIVVATLNVRYLYELTEAIPQNVNFAIKIEYLNNLVEMLPESDEINTRSGLLIGKELEDQVELITPFMVTVVAW